MVSQPIQIFKLMYLALHEEWEKDKNELFGLYLSEADPFVCGNDSADPAIYDEFLKCFNEYGTYDDYGYMFIVKYLEQLDSYYGNIKKYFMNIDKAKYINDSEAYSKLNDKEIIMLKHWEKYYQI